LQTVYNRAWHQYYTPDHIETLLRRAQIQPHGATKVKQAINVYYGSYRFQGVHPLQCGLLRRKVRTSRRPQLPVENLLLFYVRRAWDVVSTAGAMARFFLYLELLHRRIKRDPAAKNYTDLALQPVEIAEDEELELYKLTDSAKSLVAKTKSLASRSTPLVQISGNTGNRAA
jgi:hypothetical protein